MNKSEDITELMRALFEAKPEFPIIVKDKKNEFIGNRYADINTVQDIVDPILHAHGLILLTLSERDGKTSQTFDVKWNGFDKAKNPIEENTHTEMEQCVMTGLLYHVPSKQWITSTLAMTPEKADPQGVGSTITYQRRYLYVPMLGLRVADDDDDGNRGSGRQYQDDTPPPPKKPAAKKPPKASTYPTKPPTQQDVDEGAERFEKEVLDEGNDTFSKPLEKPVADADMARYKARCNAGIEALTLLMGKSPAAILAAMKLKNPATGKAVFVGKLDEVQTLEGLKTVFDKMCVMLEENEIKPAELWHQKGI